MDERDLCILVVFIVELMHILYLVVEIFIPELVSMHGFIKFSSILGQVSPLLPGYFAALYHH